MKEDRGELPMVYLKPAELHMTDRPVVVSTVLGSCVSVTMFHPRSKVGAICHGLLPRCGAGGRQEQFKFVDSSIRRMLACFDDLRIDRGEIEVKVFGGAEMHGVIRAKRLQASVGRQNVETAIGMIHEEGLRIITSDTGGSRGRKILFFTHTGNVLLKRLRGKAGGSG